MASKDASSPIRDMLDCSVCLEQYKEPKGLPCQHSFCKECLEKTIKVWNNGRLGLRCPACREFAPLPERGVSGFPPAFLINTLLDKLGQLAAMGLTQQCPEHKKPLEVYCATCQQFICHVCGYGEHKTHQHDLVENVVAECKKKIESVYKQLEEEKQSVHAAREVIATRKLEIKQRAEEVKAEIHQYDLSLREMLDVAEIRLHEEIDMAVEQKCRILTGQEEESKDAMAKLQDCVQMVERSLQTSPRELITSAGKLLGLVETACSQARQLINVPLESPADLAFLQNSSLTEECRILGAFHHSSVEDKCFPSGDALKRGKLRQQNKFLLEIKDADGSPIPVPKRLISSQIVCQDNAQALDCAVTEVERGRYEILYVPWNIGAHELRIMVGSKSIRNSPFPVTVFHPVRTISTLSKPCSVTISRDGNIVVYEDGVHCVTILSSDGNRLNSFGSRGSSLGQFDGHISGLTMTSDDYVVVADRGNCRIQVFDLNGRLIGCVGEKGTGPCQFRAPRGVATHPSGHVYVSDAIIDRITVLNGQFTYQDHFGRNGSGAGSFYQPCGIAINSQGSLFVCDSLNNRIQILSSSGQFLGQFSSKGKEGFLSRPIGIAIDSRDNVYVTEKHSHVVSVFTARGDYLRSIGNKASADGKYKSPQGLAIDANDNLYVCDHESSQLVIISLE